MLTKRNVMIATVAASAGLVAATLDVLAGDRKPKAAAAPRGPDAKIFHAPDVQPEPTWKGWKVEVLPTVKGAKRELHLALANVLSGMTTAPAGRIDFFQAFDTPNYRLDGWHAYIESASPTVDGAIVTLRVRPRLACTYGPSVTVLDSVLERYEMAGGAVHYLDSADGGFPRGIITD